MTNEELPEEQQEHEALDDLLPSESEDEVSSDELEDPEDLSINFD